MRKRLDIVLVGRRLPPKRLPGRDLLKGGKVLFDGEVCMKAGAEVDVDEALSLREAGPPAVSRGGAKLASALASFEFDPAGLVALDGGASTGGFTEVLLRRGAAKVY